MADPVDEFSANLQAAQTQGLPFAGSSGIGTPGVARPPLAPVQVQRPPMSAAEGIGRMLEGFGAGTRGQMAPWEQIQLAEQERALKQQQLAQGQQGLEQQGQHIQAQLAMNAVDMFTKLSTTLQGIPDDKERQKYAAMFAPLMVQTHQMVTGGPRGLPAAPLDLQQATELLSKPGATQEWLKNNQDAAPQDLAVAKTMKPAEANKFLEDQRKQRVTALLPQLEQEVAKYVEALRVKNPGTMITVPQIEKGIEDVVANAPDEAIRKQYGVSKSMARDAISEWLHGPKSRQFLQERGVAIGGQKPSDLGLTETLASYVQQQPEFKKAGINIGDFGTLPPEVRGRILEGARRAEEADKAKVAASTGYAAAIAGAQAKRDEPLIQSAPNLFPVHVKSEQPLDRVMNSYTSVTKMGGEKTVRFLDQKQYEAFTSAKELEALLTEFVDLSKALTTRPGANFGQALSYYAKTKFGVENPGVAFDALQGANLRVARAMQGSSQNLSNLDTKSTAGLLPSPQDTAQTALQRLEVVAGIVQNMKDVQLGKVSAGDLLSRIKTAHEEVNAKNAGQAEKVLPPGMRVIEGPSGVQKVVPNAGALPEGWKEIRRGR
jgi:hypothetical protein